MPFDPSPILATHAKYAAGAALLVFKSKEGAYYEDIHDAMTEEITRRMEYALDEIMTEAKAAAKRELMKEVVEGRAALREQTYQEIAAELTAFERQARTLIAEQCPTGTTALMVEVPEILKALRRAFHQKHLPDVEVPDATPQ